MAKKAAHTDSRFFDYLNGKLEAPEARLIEAHLADCEQCASAAAVVRAIKNEVSESKATAPSSQHPDVSELASFFYNTGQAVSSPVARHVASCASCAEEIAQYAAGEQAASEYELANARRAEVPAQAWEMIREWEESSFAKLKPASDVLTRELLERVSRILKTREPRQAESAGERVPVLVISRSGEVRSVEYFEKAVDSTGTQVLRHALGSERFDNRLVHALLDVGADEPVVVSELVRSDSLRLERVPRFEKLRRVDYLIIDENED